MSASTVTVAGRDVDYDLEVELRIDRGNLDEEFGEQPRLFAKWAALTVEARYAVEESKVSHDRAVAEADSAVRKRLDRQGDKVTEGKVSAAVPLEPDVVDAKDAHMEARRVHGLCEAAQRAFEHRLQMLIGLGANYRVEAGLDPTIVTKQKQEAAAGRRSSLRGKTRS